MATWTFSTAGRKSTITLSGKNKFLDINFDYKNDNWTYVFEGRRSGNDLVLSFFNTNNGQAEKTLTIKNFSSYINNVWFKSEWYDDQLKNLFDDQYSAYVGNFSSKKSQTIKGTEMSELIMGGRGNDKIYSNGGKDFFMPGNGNDLIYSSNEKIFIL